MATVNFKVIKNFFNDDELKIIKKYCDSKLDEGEYRFDPQSFSPAWYHDPLMISLLEFKLPKVEKESNLELFPTYAYWRYYVFGGSLAQHRDRPSCEVSITSCIKKYDDWPLIIEGKTIELEEGDGLLYAGCVQKHGRPGVYKGDGMAQLFLHYVDKNGNFKHHAYDNFTKETDKKYSEEDLINIKNEIINYKKYNQQGRMV